jgi:hypothetical protein
MASVLSIVSATIDPDRFDDVRRPLEAAIAAGLPPAIVRTQLLRGEDGVVAIATLWRDRSDLDAMRATGEEPFARRVLREAGGTPRAAFFDVVLAS